MKHIFFSVLFCVTIIFSYAQNIRYVTQNGAGSRDGSSWQEASNDIQLMINDLEQNNGGQVWVAKGTYTPIYHYGGTENLVPIIPTPPATDPQYEELHPFPFDPQREVSFVLKKNVEVYGGFIGNETKLFQRDWKTNVTTLDGQDISYHVVISVGDVGNACLDGFSIIGGAAFTKKELPYDGEVYYTNFGPHDLWGTPLMLSDQNGGGIYLLVSSPRLANLKIFYNKAGDYGGAITIRSSSSELRNIEIYDNTSGRHGGGMFINVSDPVLDSIAIYMNTSFYGGGVYDEVTTTLYRNVIIDNNNASDFGGGMHIVGSNSILVNVRISENVLVGGDNGGGIYNNRSNTTMINMTMVNNTTSTGKYAGIYNYMYPLNIYNSIVYGSGNIVNDVYETMMIGSSTYDRCLIQKMFPPGNNLDGNTVTPDFVYPNPNGDYHLLPYSQCIDFGDQGYVNPYTQIDLDGKPRVSGANVDLGVYEYQISFADGKNRRQKSLAENNFLPETSLAEMTLNVYPNPVYNGEQINIYLGNDMLAYDKQVDVKLFSMEGKLIYNKNFPNGNNRISFPELRPGMYIFTLQTAEGTLYNQKIIIKE
jgi:hypothetical protein